MNKSAWNKWTHEVIAVTAVKICGLRCNHPIQDPSPIKSDRNFVLLLFGYKVVNWNNESLNNKVLLRHDSK